MTARFRLLVVGLTLTAGAWMASAGGFLLEIGKPEANPEALQYHAVLQVRGYGCVSPEKTTLSAMAIGMVDGRRQEIALKLLPLKTQGLYAVTRQWPSGGSWVIVLSASNPAFSWHPSAIVKTAGDGVDWRDITRLPHSPSAQEIDEALNTINTAQLKRQ